LSLLPGHGVEIQAWLDFVRIELDPVDQRLDVRIIHRDHLIR
jgi:hypothetical protein